MIFSKLKKNFRVLFTTWNKQTKLKNGKYYKALKNSIRINTFFLTETHDTGRYCGQVSCQLIVIYYVYFVKQTKCLFKKLFFFQFLKKSQDGCHLSQFCANGRLLRLGTNKRSSKNLLRVNAENWTEETWVAQFNVVFLFGKIEEKSHGVTMGITL